MPAFLSKKAFARVRKCQIERKYSSGESKAPIAFFVDGQTGPVIKDKEVAHFDDAESIPTQPNTPVDSGVRRRPSHGRKVSFVDEPRAHRITTSLSSAEKQKIWWSHSDREEFKICEAVRRQHLAVARDAYRVGQIQTPMTIDEYEAKVELEAKKQMDMAIAFQAYEKAQAAKPWYEVLMFWKSSE